MWRQRSSCAVHAYLLQAFSRTARTVLMEQTPHSSTGWTLDYFMGDVFLVQIIVGEQEAENYNHPSVESRVRHCLSLPCNVLVESKNAHECACCNPFLYFAVMYN